MFICLKWYILKQQKEWFKKKFNTRYKEKSTKLRLSYFILQYIAIGRKKICINWIIELKIMWYLLEKYAKDVLLNFQILSAKPPKSGLDTIFKTGETVNVFQQVLTSNWNLLSS